MADEQTTNSQTQTIPQERNAAKATAELNGDQSNVNLFHPLEIELKKKENLNDPIMDLQVKLNNPIGRLWLAIKHLWKSQKTTITFRITIPLLVLPIVLYLGYRLWIGRGVNTPIAKVGIIQAAKLNGKDEHILIIPTSDAYILRYPSSIVAVPSSDQPVIVFGTYSQLSNELYVDKLAVYSGSSGNTMPVPGIGYQIGPQSWSQALFTGMWTPISDFLRIFQ